jgi:predicted nucleotidyltransferase
MRLSEQEISAIKETVAELDADARVVLFGSRADDAKRGGDIDLLIMSQKLGFKEKRKIRLELFKKLGEQKIDVIVARDTSDPFVRMALKGVVL